MWILHSPVMGSIQRLSKNNYSSVDLNEFLEDDLWGGPQLNAIFRTYFIQYKENGGDADSAIIDDFSALVPVKRWLNSPAFGEETWPEGAEEHESNCGHGMMEDVKRESFYAAASAFFLEHVKVSELRHPPHVVQNPYSPALVFIFKLDKGGTTYRVAVTCRYQEKKTK